MADFPYFTEDIENVFLAEFAVAATITKESGDTVDVMGIFNSTYEDVRVGGYHIDTQNPNFLVEYTDEVRDVRRNDLIAIDGDSYRISSTPRSDGTGMAYIYLQPNDRLDNTGNSFTNIN